MKTPIQEIRNALDKNEKNHDYAIATDSVRAYLDLIEEQFKQAIIEAITSTFPKDVKMEKVEENGNCYYIMFNEDTTKELAEQYYKDKYETNEH